MEEIQVGDRELYTRIHSYFDMEMPERSALLRLYDDAGSGSSASCTALRQRWKKALREKAWLKTGGYLIIQPTEALTVIDVNSGKSIAGKGKNEERDPEDQSGGCQRGGPGRSASETSPA